MTKAQLIDFRAKLVRAKEFYRPHESIYPGFALDRAGLHEDINYRTVWPKGLRSCWSWIWLATPKERIALWDNSIAHADKLIKEAK